MGTYITVMVRYHRHNYQLAVAFSLYTHNGVTSLTAGRYGIGLQLKIWSRSNELHEIKSHHS